MKISDFLNEEKTRLDPACWTGKKIGTPKTKVKGGVRVNNCVPKEGVAEGSVTPDVNVSKVHDDGHEKEWHIYRGKEMIGYVIKNQPDTAEGLYIAYGHGPGRAFVEEFTGLKSAVNYITSLKEGVAEGSLREQASKLLSAQDKDGIITIIVQAPDGTKRSAASSNPNAINKWLMKYGLRLPKNIADLFVGVTEEFRPTTGQAMGIRSQIAQKMNPGSSKFIWKRPNQIAGSHTENELRALKFRYSAKYNSWGGTQHMWSQLEDNLKEFAPTKPPTAGAFGGNKDYGQPTSSRYSNGNKFVLGTTNNYVLTATVDKWGLEWDEDNNIWYLDSPGAAHIADATEGEIELPAPQEQRNQIHDLVTDYLNDHNSADLQRVAAYYGHSADGEMATSEGVRVPAQQILGTKNRAKSAYYPTNVKPKVPKLDTPLTDRELARLSQLAGIDTNK